MNSKLGFHSLLFILFSFSIISVSNGQNYSLHIKNSEHSCKEYNYVDIGDLSITGDKLTIEAIIRTISNGECQFSPHHDVVSKHYDNTDVNYLLRPGYATINTENGFYQTKPLTVTNNECHHIAMVYDGLFLRFYLDDFMDSVRATGNLITNNYNTLIGYTAGFNPNWYTQYFGYIDEVRFWNVARTKKQIKENAYTSIADPVNHDGLKAYFDFQTGYQNKAGNEIHNGVKKGNCALDVDTASCTVNHSPDKLNKIIMYPNLIYYTGTIRFNVEVTNAEITIFDGCGKKLNIIKEISGNELKIDRKKVASGLYFVILKQENKAISISKLVVID